MCRHVDKLDLQKDYSVLRSFFQPTSRYIAPCYYHDDVSILTYYRLGTLENRLQEVFSIFSKENGAQEREFLNFKCFKCNNQRLSFRVYI
jgi:hypothetical protein